MMNNSVVTLLITSNHHSWIMFFLIDWLSFGKGVRLKLDDQCQDGETISDIGGKERGEAVLKIGL